jgi:peptide/nickel transport system permease protein
MLRYTAKRFGHAIICVLGISIIVFLITHIIGDPVSLLLPPEASEADHNHYRQALGLDKPLSLQYLDFVRKALRGDFGTSFRYKVPVVQLLGQKFPATLELAIAATLFAVLLGGGSGIFSALRRGTLIDRFIRGFSLLGMSTPTFWVGIMLILIFGVHLSLFPISGRGGVRALVLPSITLGWYSSAVIARMTRSTMIDVLGTDYIRMAIMKGATRRAIILRHCLRNVSTTMVTVISLQFVILLAGAVITETVFAWPGIGRLMVQAVLARDYPVIQAITLLCSVIFVLINLFVDLLYVLIDPRIRLA